MKINQQNGVCEAKVFSTIFKANSKSIRNYLFYKYGNEEHANDLTQTAFLKLWENCAMVAPEKALAYLYRIVNNDALNKIAHQKVVLNYAKNNYLNSQNNENPAFILEEKQFKEKLQKAIENLTEGQRTAFLLNRIEGKKYVEIAEILGISVKAVEKRISGALLSLRNQIDNIKI
jgi:RNA polymerase sigma-70 factor (family 1)